MTDNEKAAIAAGLWGPGQKCCGCNSMRHVVSDHCEFLTHPHDLPAPDMHDPANLWRALGHLPPKYDWTLLRGACRIRRTDNPLHCLVDKPDLLRALVALYDAEHPQE